MRTAVRIRSRGSITVALSGLTAAEEALLTPASGAAADHPGISRRAGGLDLAGTPEQFRRFCSRLRTLPGLPADLPARIETHLDNHLRQDYKIALRGRTLDLGGRTHVMGVLNVTPDSFSDGGAFLDHAAAVRHAADMAAAGADIIDIGGESTRPGADPVPEDEELARILPVIRRTAAETQALVSVDTYKAAVARRALEAGAAIVNDISGLRFSPDMARIVADHDAAVVVMHIKGTPRDMQAAPAYDDVVSEVLNYLGEGVAAAHAAGVGRDRVLIDPGIGFGKTKEHNLELLDRLDEFRVLGCPIVLGTSRKRFIGAVLDLSEPRDRMLGTAATVTLGIERGAHIIRVHDVPEMVQVARMTDAVVRSER